MNSDIMTEPAKPTRPSLRERQRQQTRAVIFEGVLAVLSAGELTDLSFPTIAAAAGISERTVYRHFADLKILLEAFWPWFVENLGPAGHASTAEELAISPPKTFAAFDQHAGPIRALMSSAAGRAARDRTNAARKAALHAAIEDAVGAKIPADDLRMLAAGIDAVCSAYGWAAMRDLWKLEGVAAGNAAAMAVGWMIDGYVAEQNRRKSKGRGG